jgi:two-component system sensor histidine kinase YesM
MKIRNRYGKTLIIVYDTIPINRWKLAAIFPEADISNRAVFMKRMILAVAVFLILAALLLADLLASKVTNPLMTLAGKVKQVQAGDLNVPFDVRHANEIGILNEGLGG